MVKLNFINQKACLINWVLQFYLYQILVSILMVPLNFNNQKHLQLINLLLIIIIFFYHIFFQIYCTFTFFS